MVGVDGLEPSTSPLSEVRSNQLSYTPICKKHFRKNFYTNSNHKIKPFSKKLFYIQIYLAFSLFFTTQKVILFLSKNINGYNLLYNMNNFVYSRYNRLYFTMTSMTTTMIYINTTSSIFYGQTIFTMICNNSVNFDDYINNTWLLSANLMNQKILMNQARKSMMYYLNDYMTILLTFWYNIMPIFMSINLRISIQRQYAKSN